MKSLIITLRLLSLIIFLSTPTLTLAMDSDDEDFEKRRYCQYHAHYEDCKYHRCTKHCSYEKDSLDYSGSSISDSKVQNPSVQHLDKVLLKLNKKIIHLENYHPKSNIKISFADNYLKDDGFKELYEFMMEKQHLKKRLKEINLRHNKITEDSLPTLKDFLKDFPKLKIDISVNRISRENFDEFFGNSAIKNRITFSSY